MVRHRSGRIGYAASGTLVYFTGGFAFGWLTQDGEDVTWPAAAYYKSNGTVTGYVLGGGIEYRFNPSWSFKGEYQYLNFGKNDPTLVCDGCGAPATISGDEVRIEQARSWRKVAARQRQR